MKEQNKSIAVIAPSGACGNQERVMNAFEKIKASGYELIIGSNFANWFLPTESFHLNTEDRLKELRSAFHSKANYIWAVRGGYGCAKLLPRLAKDDIPSNKTLIGFSDITALEIFLWQSYNIHSIHASVVSQLHPEYDELNFMYINALMSNNTYPNIKLHGKNDFACNVRGAVIGGNLTVIASLLGTPYQIDTRDRILFIEDVNEDGYKIDRMLLQLKLAGKFKNVKAIILGAFIGTQNQNDKWQSDVNYAINKFARSNTIPIFTTDHIGHGYHNYPIMQGMVYDIKGESNNAFKLEPLDAHLQ